MCEDTRGLSHHLCFMLHQTHATKMHLHIRCFDIFPQYLKHSKSVRSVRSNDNKHISWRRWGNKKYQQASLVPQLHQALGLSLHFYWFRPPRWDVKAAEDAADSSPQIFILTECHGSFGRWNHFRKLFFIASFRFRASASKNYWERSISYPCKEKWPHLSSWGPW